VATPRAPATEFHKASVGNQRQQLRQLAEVFSRRLAQEQIYAAIDEPDTIPFNIPTGPCCNPETIEELKQLLRIAIRARFLTTGEIFEIILDQIIEAWGPKLHSKELGKSSEVIQRGFGCAVMLLEADSRLGSTVKCQKFPPFDDQTPPLSYIHKSLETVSWE
jgi:hypothetical protein